ncbi:hypothetical protein Tco_0972205 [Tanacetum coccineum]
MADKVKKSTMKGFETNDQADSYSGITSITVNRKNAYEVKGKFLDDLHKNAFSGTNGENAKLGSDEIEPTDLEETDHDDEQEIGEIFRIETNLFDYETLLYENFKEFNYLLRIDPNVLTKDIEGFKTYDEYKGDWIYEWNENVPWIHEKPWTDTGVWIEPAPVLTQRGSFKNKAIMEGMIDDNDESSNNGWRRLDGYKIAELDQEEREYENEHEDEERCELFDNHELPVCTVRRFEMIKYSFGQDEEYVAVKEHEYEDLMSTRKDACRAYQEIFRIMDEG